MELKTKILYRLSLHYSDRQKAIDWFVKPNMYFQVDKDTKASTPQQMLDSGKGDEVWNWIVMTIGE